MSVEGWLLSKAVRSNLNGWRTSDLLTNVRTTFGLGFAMFMSPFLEGFAIHHVFGA